MDGDVIADSPDCRLLTVDACISEGGLHHRRTSRLAKASLAGIAVMSDLTVAHRKEGAYVSAGLNGLIALISSSKIACYLYIL